MTVLAVLVARGGDGHLLGCRESRDAEPGPFFLRINGFPDRDRVAPTAADVGDFRDLAHQPFGLFGQRGERVDVGTDESDFDGRFDRRRQFEQRRAYQQVGEIGAGIGVETLLHRRRRVFRGQFHQQVAEIGFRAERSAGQVVPRRRTAHRRRDVLNGRLP